MAVRISKKTAQDAVYTVLKEGIMTLSLPPGTAMSTQEMATRLNVSRTPVREAFIRLQEEGLVVVFPPETDHCLPDRFPKGSAGTLYKRESGTFRTEAFYGERA